MSHVSYASALGSLMYAMVCTRPDLSQVVSMRPDLSQPVSIISRYMHDPGKGHWEAMRWILRYITGTVNVGLDLKKDDCDKHECIGYMDSDYAGDLDKRRSTTTYMFTLSQTPVSWHCTVQSIVALLTIEAEYMTLDCEGGNMALGLDG